MEKEKLFKKAALDIEGLQKSNARYKVEASDIQKQITAYQHKQAQQQAAIASLEVKRAETEKHKAKQLDSSLTPKHPKEHRPSFTKLGALLLIGCVLCAFYGGYCISPQKKLPQTFTVTLV